MVLDGMVGTIERLLVLSLCSAKMDGCGLFLSKAATTSYTT